MSSFFRRYACFVLTVLSVGCSERGSLASGNDAGAAAASAEAPHPAASDSPPPAEPATAQPVATVTETTASAGDLVTIPAGSLRVGGAPGVPHRRPSVEADLVSVAMPEVRIDRLPYPNDPAQPPHLAGTRAEASALCAQREQRLCGELEWERACRGDGNAEFATGEALDVDACVTDPVGCASPYGVLSLGIASAEWTASDAEPALARLERTAVIRGGHRSDPVHRHRCGARQVHNPAGGGRALAFRCCSGPAPELSYPDVGQRRVFRDLELDSNEWRAILRTIEPLAPYAESFVPYGEEAATRAIGGHEVPWEVAMRPFAWSPSRGEEVWLVAGRSGERTLIVALYPMPDGSKVHAASFVFDDEVTPVALMRTHTSRDEVLWTTCSSCMGESGVIQFRDDATITIAQR